MYNYKILFLDDRIERWNFFSKFNPAAIWVTNSADCIKQINLYDDIGYIFLDHDLGPDDNGMKVVDHLVEYRDHYNEETVKPIIIIHTWNAPAGDMMVKALERQYYHCIRLPFSFNINLHVD